MKFFHAIVVIIFLVVIFSSCSKVKLTTNPQDKLSFTTDTLTFDTVFTSLGSDTRYFKILNTHSKSIKISTLRLGGGSSSFFRLNVDGVPTKTELHDLEIAPHDSMWVFAAVTIDPNNQNNPFVVEDSVMFETNGNEQKVLLMAYGQNAHFYRDSVICNETWNPDKPYVIINSVLVNSGCTLTINPGCRIFNHAGSQIYVNGTLKVLGTPTDSVVFRGDRLENYFVDLPGNWGGIHFLKFSQDNEIDNAIIKEATVGVRVDSLSVNANPKLILKQTRINYCLSAGILGITSTINAENCLVINCGENNLQLELGGNNQFTNCTFADFSNTVINHEKPVLRAGNYLDLGSVILLADLHTTLTNCIIYGGNAEEEMDLDTTSHSGVVYDVQLNHCLIKTKNPANTSAFQSCTINTDPQFNDISKDNYHLLSSSPCKNAGTAVGAPTVDLDNFPRDAAPDIGCFEFH